MKEAVVNIDIFVPTGNEQVSNVHRTITESIHFDTIEEDVDALTERLKNQIIKIKKG